MKKAILLSTIAALCCGLHRTSACTGIALSAADGSYVQSRTIEWPRGMTTYWLRRTPRDHSIVRDCT